MNRVIKIFIIPVFVFCVNIMVSAQNDYSNEPWFFIQLSDPQLGMFDHNKGFEIEIDLLEKAISHINRLHPSFVVITGDFVHDQNSKDQISAFQKLISKIDPAVPLYLLPGNHDIGQIPDVQSLRKYRKTYGKDRFFFLHNGTALIGLNSSLIKAKLDQWEQKQYNWLVKTLKDSRDAEHVILFCHYPFFIKTFDEPEQYSNIAPEYRKRYLSLFDLHKVRAVFSGHLHDNLQNHFKQMELVITSALGKPLGKAPSGMRIVKVYKEIIEHEYYGLDEVPDTVEFEIEK